MEEDLEESFSSLDPPFAKVCEKLSTLQDVQHKYSVSKILAEGPNSTIQLGNRVSDNHPFSIKMVQKNEQSIRAVVKATKILAALDSPHILGITEVMETENNLFVVRPLCLGGSLPVRMRRRLSHEDVKSVFRQILVGLKHLSDHRIVLRQLDPAKILFQTEGQIDHVMLTDFSFATTIDSLRVSDAGILGHGHHEFTPKTLGRAFKPQFLAPEVLDKGFTTCKADMWSSGLLLYMMLGSGQEPFCIPDDDDVPKKRLINLTCQRVRESQLDYSDPVWTSVPPAARHLVDALVHRNQFQRLSPMEALAHPWLSGFDELPALGPYKVPTSDKRRRLKVIGLVSLFASACRHHSGPRERPRLYQYRPPHVSVSPISSPTTSHVTTPTPTVHTPVGFLPHNPTPLDQTAHARSDPVRGTSCPSPAGGTTSTPASQPASYPADEPIPYRRGKLIGTGACGRVFSALNERTGEMMAVKNIPFDTSDPKIQSKLAQLQREINVLKTTRHPNIVHYVAITREKNAINIWMELVSGGSVASLLEDMGPLNEHVVARYTKQILLGLQYLHDNHVCHRDIKGANILLSVEGDCKLADFGGAVQKELNDIGQSVQQHTMTGTPYWMSPEVVKGDGHSTPTDIWSLGCCVMEMLTARAPWSHTSDKPSTFQVMSFIVNEPEPLHLPDTISPNSPAGKFIHACCQRDPTKRPTCSQLLTYELIRLADIESPRPSISATRSSASVSFRGSPPPARASDGPLSPSSAKDLAFSPLSQATADNSKSPGNSVGRRSSLGLPPAAPTKPGAHSPQGRRHTVRHAKNHTDSPGITSRESGFLSLSKPTPPVIDTDLASSTNTASTDSPTALRFQMAISVSGSSTSSPSPKPPMTPSPKTSSLRSPRAALHTPPPHSPHPPRSAPASCSDLSWRGGSPPAGDEANKVFLRSPQLRNVPSSCESNHSADSDRSSYRHSATSEALSTFDENLERHLKMQAARHMDLENLGSPRVCHPMNTCPSADMDGTDDHSSDTPQFPLPGVLTDSIESSRASSPLSRLSTGPSSSMSFTQRRQFGALKGMYPLEVDIPGRPVSLLRRAGNSSAAFDVAQQESRRALLANAAARRPRAQTQQNLSEQIKLMHQLKAQQGRATGGPQTPQAANIPYPLSPCPTSQPTSTRSPSFRFMMPRIMISATGEIITSNKAVKQLLGWKEDELRGQPVTILMPDDIGSVHQLYLDRSNEAGAPSRKPFITTARHRDGRLLSVSMGLAQCTVPRTDADDPDAEEVVEYSATIELLDDGCTRTPPVALPVSQNRSSEPPKLCPASRTRTLPSSPLFRSNTSLTISRQPSGINLKSSKDSDCGTEGDEQPTSWPPTPSDGP